MPNRYDNGSDYPNNSDRRNNQRHIKNTDNENTQYINANSDSDNTAEFNVTGYNAPRTERRSASQYGENNGQSTGRQQYYNSQQQYNRQPNQQNRQNNQQYNQYDNMAQNQQYDGYDEQYDEDAQYQQYDNYGQPQYNSNNMQNNQNNQYRRAPQQRSGQPRPQGGNTQQRQPRNGYNNGNDNRRSAPPNRNSGGQPPRNNPPQKKRPQNPQNQPVRQRKSPAQKPRRKKHSFIFKIFIIIILLIAVLFGVYSCTAISLIKKLNYVESGDRNHVAGALQESYVTSVLLIGTDGRDVNDRGRSDTMILLSINKKSKEISLTSFMRDSYVDIPGYGWEKLNSSYSYGGPDLLMDTIEKNFSVRVDDYISVNFNSFAAIIDAVGGIEIDVSDAEAQEINTILMAEVNELMGDAVDADLLGSGGKLQLNGKQALSYARIRHIGNADFERTERQRTVLTQVAGKLKSMNPSMISKITSNAVPQITTNMSTSDLYFLSLRLPFVIGYDIEQIRVPAEGTYGNVTTPNGGAALEVDFNTNYDIVKEEVFGK